MSLFISSAHAQASGGAAQGGGMEMIIMLAVFGLIFLLPTLSPSSEACKRA